MKLDNPETGKRFGLRNRFKVCIGMYYLGVFIWGDESKRDSLLYCTLKWENNTETIKETAKKYHQESYSTEVHTIQPEWIFLQRMTIQGIYLRRSGEDSLGNLFALPIIRKIEISPTHCRNFKYDSSQEIRPRPTRPGDIS